VFVPLPVKPSVYPEAVWPGYPPSAGPAWNRDRAAFKARLADGGVDVLDVTDDLWQAKARPGGKLFLNLTRTGRRMACQSLPIGWSRT